MEKTMETPSSFSLYLERNENSNSSIQSNPLTVNELEKFCDKQFESIDDRFWKADARLIDKTLSLEQRIEEKLDLIHKRQDKLILRFVEKIDKLVSIFMVLYLYHKLQKCYPQISFLDLQEKMVGLLLLDKVSHTTSSGDL